MDIGLRIFKWGSITPFATVIFCKLFGQYFTMTDITFGQVRHNEIIGETILSAMSEGVEGAVLGLSKLFYWDGNTFPSPCGWPLVHPVVRGGKIFKP